MNREQYLAQLRRSLGRAAEEEKREILADYEEHFRAGLAEGRSEEAIVQALGSPAMIGRIYRIESLADEHREGWGAADTVRAVFASVSLGFFNALFLLGPFAGLMGVLAGLWAAAASIGLAGVAAVVAGIAGPFLPVFAGTPAGMAPAAVVACAILAGIGLAATGLLAVIGMAAVTRWFLVLTARYVRFNARIITGRKRVEE